MQKRSSLSFIGSLCCACSLAGQLHAEDTWWNHAWTLRQKLTLNTGTDGAAIAETPGGSTVLVRLTDANFQFGSAREDGGDLRFVAADGKTLLPHQIESYDGVLSEAFIWVKLPEVKPASKDSFYVYFSNTDAAMPAAAKPADAYDGDTTLVYHFGGRGTAPVDATGNNNNAENSGASAEGSLIGSGLKLAGTTRLTIPNSATLEWKLDQPLTLSVWIKPSALQANAVILSRVDGKSSMRLLLDQGVPVIEVTSGVAPLRSQPAAPLAAGTWSHLTLAVSYTHLTLPPNREV